MYSEKAVKLTYSVDDSALKNTLLLNNTMSKAAARLSSDAISAKVIEGTIFRTPVDTGRARAGWGMAGSDLGFKMNVKPSDGTNKEGVQTGNRSESGDGKGKKINAIKFIGNKIINSVIYIGHLEFGTPKMQPFAPLRLTLASLRIPFKGITKAGIVKAYNAAKLRATQSAVRFNK